MIQCKEKKIDIYQILSYCLRFLKTKILTLIKFLLNEKNYTPKPQLITDLANQQIVSQEYLEVLRETQNSFLKKEDDILLQRFVSRIKQLVRNYLPHATFSNQLLLFLKKIQTYNFKPNFKFQDYIFFIVEGYPINLEKQIKIRMDEIKNQQRDQINGSQEQNTFLGKKSLCSSDTNLNEKCNQNQQVKRFWLNGTINHIDQRYQTFSNQFLNQSTQKNRPIDIFNNYITPIDECLDLDYSTFRAIYFNLHKEKQTLTLSKNFSDPLSTSNQTIKQIQEEMIFQNRQIKEAIKSFDRSYYRYQQRLQKNLNFEKKKHKRSQTADPTGPKFNYSIFYKQSHELEMKPNNQKRKKFSTVNYFPSEEQRQELYKQIQKKRSNVLKMKSISISVNKSNLQLCSLTKEKSKKISFTLTSFKKQNSNYKKQTSNNLKKKYQMFMNSCIENNSIPKQSLKSDVAVAHFIQPRNQKNLVVFDEKLKCNYNTIQMNESQLNRKISVNPHYLQEQQEKKTIGFSYIISSHNSKKKHESKVIENRKHTAEKNSKRNISLHIVDQLDTSIKGFMKGNNLNHRNYTSLQYRSKRLFDTMNPDLNIRNFVKS